MEKGERIENGEFYVAKSEDGKYLSVGEVETGFEVKFGENLAMYSGIESLLEDEDGFEVIAFLVRTMFVDCNTMWDTEYYEDRDKSVRAYVKRLKKNLLKTSPKDAMVVASLAGMAEN